MKKAAIIGCGLVCGIGINKEEVTENIFREKNGFKELTKFDAKSCDRRIVSEVDDSRIKVNPENRRLTDRSSMYLLKAAEEALADAGLDLSDYDPCRTGVIIGTSVAGIELAEDFYEDYKEKANGRIRNLLQHPLYTCADIISGRYKIQGPKMVISTACSSSASAIGYAADLIKTGIIDLAVCGGGDSLVKLSYSGFYSLKNISTQGCSPFSENSVGLSLGEGAGIVILCEKGLAAKTGKKIYGFVKGFGIGTDAYHPTAPDPLGRGAVQSMTKAIEAAGLKGREEEIVFINAHGTGTVHNDRIETRAIKKVFGDEPAKKIAVSSSKSMAGHTLGGAGAVGVVFSCLGKDGNYLPPTMNFTTPRAGCDLNYVPNLPEKDVAIPNFLVNAFAFGGNNVSVLIGDDYEDCSSKEVEPAVISGMGIISALGNSAAELYDNIKKGHSGIHTFDYDFEGFCRLKTRKASFIRDFDLKQIGRFKNFRRMDRISRLAVGAGVLALRNTGIVVTPQNDKDVGIIYGTGTGPVETLTRFYDTIIDKGLQNGESALFANTVANAACGYLGIETGIKGHATTIVNGNASGLLSLVMGQQALNQGYGRHFLCGCADEYSTSLQKALVGLGVHSGKQVDDDSPQPMGRDRDGIICGEGAAFCFLESESSALSAGREIYGTIAGSAVTSDLCGLSRNDPEGRGMEMAINLALRKAGIDKEQIDVVFSSAAGYSLKDLSEGKAIKRALDDVPVFLISPFVGEVFGSIGLFSLAIGLMGFKHDYIPAINRNYTIDPDIGCNLMLQTPLNRRINHILLTANSMGGLNTAVIIKRGG